MGIRKRRRGGNAIRFFSAVRLDLRIVGTVKKDGVIAGRKLRIKLPKNVVSASMQEVEIDHIFGQGLDKAGELLDLAVEKQVVTAQGGWFRKNGAWYSYGDERIGQGRPTARAWLYQHPEIMEKLEQTLREDSLQEST